MYKRIIALFSCFVILFSCVPFAHAEYTSDNQGANFWDWAMIYGNKYGSGTSISGVVQAVTGWMSGKVCSLSPDSYHHSDVKPNAFGNGGRDDSGSYVWCTCKYCGDQFKLYTSIDNDHGGGFGKSDLQQSYEAQVEELPAQGYDSGGKLHFKLSVSAFEEDSCCISSSFLGTDWRVALVSGSTGVSSPKTGVYGYFDEFIAPVAGDYSLACYITSNKSCDFYYFPSSTYTVYYFSSKHNLSACSYGAPRPKFGEYFVYESIRGFKAGDLIISSDERFGLNGTTGTTLLYSGYWELLCSPISVFGDTYNINSRPTSITGDYGIIGDNGQIIKVEGDKIVNETNNNYYNPATGETTTITDWSYNYEDRSYTVTTESGDTVTITYGDENVVIKEGDTTYNVYYLVNGSGSENPGPGPDVPGTCNHQWAETSTTPVTCTVPGSRTLTCSLCNETKIETIPAPGHKWTVKQEVKNEYDENGNQTQERYTIWECSVCGEQQKTTDGTAPPGGGSGTGSGSSGGVFSGIFGLLVDFLGFFWNTFRDFVGEGVKGFLNALMDGTSSIFGLLNPFNWGG